MQLRAISFFVGLKFYSLLAGKLHLSLHKFPPGGRGQSLSDHYTFCPLSAAVVLVVQSFLISLVLCEVIIL